MHNDTAPGGTPGLARALGTFDLVLLYVAAIIGLRWLSTAAQLGPASLLLWALACLAFFVPCGLAIQELSSRIPHEGGLYLWTRAAFGETHGFLAGWAYWLQNLVFFPSLLLFVSGVVLHIAGRSWLSLADNPIYNGVFCLMLLWAVTLLNIIGLNRARWVQNVGGIAAMTIAALVLAGGALAWWRYGSATPLSAASLRPKWTSPMTLNTFAILLLAYTGLELAPVLGDEIRDSARSIRRAMLISGLVIALIYIAGTAALLVSLPGSQISAISGIPQAMESIGAAARHSAVRCDRGGAPRAGRHRRARGLDHRHGEAPLRHGAWALPAQTPRCGSPEVRLAPYRLAGAGLCGFARADRRRVRINDPRGLSAPERHDRGAQLRRVGVYLCLAPGSALARRGPERRDRADSRRLCGLCAGGREWVPACRPLPPWWR